MKLTANRMFSACRQVLLCLLAAVPGIAHAQGIVVFDQDDAIGADYYDASYGFQSAPSVVSLSGPSKDKLGIVTTTTNQYGVFGWTGEHGGNWKVFIANPGWGSKNAAGNSAVELVLNGPAAIEAQYLPMIGLESSPPDVSTDAQVPLGDYVPEGIDGDSGTWQTVLIPMTAFKPAPAGFSLTGVKDVWFTQYSIDAEPRVLWVDKIQLTTGGGGEPVTPPVAPTNLVAYTGDRSVILHWNRSPESSVVGYHIYSNTRPDPLYKITTSPVPGPSFAQLNADNGRRYYYAVKAVDYLDQESPLSASTNVVPRAFASDDAFLDYVQRAAFDYFWHEADLTNGLVRDRSTRESLASMAATGFGLTALGIGIDHGWITRQQGGDRALRTLRTLWNSPQGTNETGVIGYKGWFYHFVDISTGLRNSTTELSSIDTALLLAGVLYAREYFDGAAADEVEIRSLATSIFNRVDWAWMADGQASLTMGWNPGDRGFIGARWIGYNEAMILYLLGLGAETGGLTAESWAAWTDGYKWATHGDYSFVEFPPLFGHQYSHCWVDFRHQADVYMKGQGSTYFENSRRATLAQRQYCASNPGGFEGYSTNIWGLTACDGPGTGGAFGYIARGAPPAANDDGTIAPTAAGGSFPFTPVESLAALKAMYGTYRSSIWTGYGFTDAFNVGAKWWGPSVLGIDQGPILIMIENHRSQSVWRKMMSIPELQRGLELAGFKPVAGVTGLSPVLKQGSFGLQWPAAAGNMYQVEYSHDLQAWWTSPGGGMVGTGAVQTWDDTGPPGTPTAPGSTSYRFFRVLDYGLAP